MLYETTTLLLNLNNVTCKLQKNIANLLAENERLKAENERLKRQVNKKCITQ